MGGWADHSNRASSLMPFLTEPEPIRGKAFAVAPGIRRIMAGNSGPMTYHGTNTYLIDGEDGVVVIDPGPEDRRHVDAILSATGGRVLSILLTHTHRDHAGAAPALRAATGAPTAGFVEAGQHRSAPDVALRDGDSVAGLTALHTPGHASDHLCFACKDFLFTGDHVMSWSSSVVNPPDGNMAAYIRSLERLLRRNDRVYLPGHGPPLERPLTLVRELLEHRRAREASIAAALTGGPIGTMQIVDRVYGRLDPQVRIAAERNVAAHLEMLREAGVAIEAPDGRWEAA